MALHKFEAASVLFWACKCFGI